MSTGEATNGAVQSLRIIAKAINAHEEELTFTSGGTLANNIALKGLAMAHSKKDAHHRLFGGLSLICLPTPPISRKWALTSPIWKVTNWVTFPRISARRRAPDTILFMSTM